MRLLACRQAEPALPRSVFARVAARVALGLAASTIAVASVGPFDPAFGTGGAVELEFLSPPDPGSTQRAVRIRALAGGKALVLVRIETGTPSSAVAGVARLEANGTLDPTFGVGGMVVIGLPGLWLRPADMRVVDGGSIVVVGNLTSPDGIFVARLNADGTPDAGFGVDGIATTAITTQGYPPYFAVQSDGKLVVAMTGYAGWSNWTEVVLLRYGADGALDPGFGTGGVLATGLEELNCRLDAIAIQPDDAILVSYSRKLSVSDPRMGKYLARLTAAGALDASFGGTGQLAIPLPSYNDQTDTALAVLPDGGILVAAYSEDAKALGITRVLATGVSDAAFGVGGTVLAAGAATPDLPRALSVFPDGRFVVAGTAGRRTVTTDSQAAVSRFLPDGRLDPNFGMAGRLFEGTLLTGANGAAIQADGKVLVAGFNDAASPVKALAARLPGPAASEAVAGSGAASVLEGESVDLTADVFGASPTGTVTFRVGGADIAACVDVAIVAGAAACPGQVLAAGVHLVTVAYSGDADDPPATSPEHRQYVLSAGGDVDGDGVPDLVEAGEFLDPLVKDNDICAATAAGARLFAMQQYRDFLGREGEAGGIAGWAGALSSGAWTRAQVIDAFLSSAESSGFVPPVIRLYFATFQRVPDYAGLVANVELLRSGALTPVQLADAFAASPEFMTTYGALDDTQFVTLLYANVLGRTPDAAGLSGWVALLGSGYTRGQVLLGFSESAEYQAAMANEVFVTMMYAGLLRRSVDPAGFNGWVGFLDAATYTREQVIDGFLLSTEYHGRFLP